MRLAAVLLLAAGLSAQTPMPSPFAGGGGGGGGSGVTSVTMAGTALQIAVAGTCTITTTGTCTFSLPSAVTFPGSATVTSTLTVGTSFSVTGSTGASNIGPAESTLPAFIQGYTGNGQLFVTNTTNPNGLAIETTGGNGVFAVTYSAAGQGQPVGLEGDAYNAGATGGSVGVTAFAGVVTGGAGKNAYGVSIGVQADTVVADSLYAVRANAPVYSNGGTANVYWGYQHDEIGAGAANSYYSWFDSRGVRRVKEDSTFDSVGQAIEALYNPQFAKYTPGAVDFERIITGQWNGNVAEIGTEKGGTGTLRALRLLGPSVEAVSYKTNTKCANAASPAVCAAAPAGAVAIPTGVTTVSLVVNTTAVTASSQIKLQADDSLTIAATTCNNTLATLVGGLAVTARTPGTSFTITYNGTIATNPLCVAYSILN